MKYIKGISLIIAGAVLALIAVSAVYVYRGGDSAPFVTVEVINNSDSEITQIKIEHEDGYVYHDHLGRGKRVYLPVYASGESSYNITVQLQNGKMNEEMCFRFRTLLRAASRRVYKNAYSAGCWC